MQKKLAGRGGFCIFHTSADALQHQPTKPMKNNITVLLFRIDNEWTLSSLKGGSIPSNGFPTAKAACEYAKQKRWSVRRAADCDA